MSPSVWPKAVPLLVLAGLLAYADCYSKTLIFDDDAWVTDQPMLDDAEAYFKAMKGRPLLAATNLALHRLGRSNPLGHHILNVFIHLAAGLTLYGVARRSLLRPRFRGRFTGRAPYLAFAVALLWMLHPLQVQCVTYIIQRGESMAGLFYLLVLYALLRAEEVTRPSPTGDGLYVAETVNRPRWFSLMRIGWYALAVVSVLLGYMSKEIMASIPGAVLLFDRIFLAPSVWKVVRRRWLFYLFFFAAWGGFTYWHLTRAADTEGGIGFKMETLTPTKYALTETGVLLYYLQISVWPRGLAIDYQSWPWWETASEAMPELAIVGGLLLVTAVLVFWRPAVGFVCAWYFITLAPTSSFLPIIDPVFEHRMYLPLASVVVLGVFLGDWLLRKVRLGWVRPFALAAAAIALGALTHLRNEEYRSRAAVWEAAVARMPDSVRARANLSQGLIADRRSDEAVPVLARALELSQYDPTALQNMAAAQEQLGNYREAAEYYYKLLSVYPNDWRYYRMYAATLLLLGHYPEAEEVYRRTAELNSGAAEARYGRAAALFKMGRAVSADVEARGATDLDPLWPEGVLGMARGTILDEEKRAHPDARRSALIWAGLGMEYLPNPHPMHRDTLGLCYAAAGEFEKAAAQSRLALEECPTGPWGSVHRDRLRHYERKQVPWPE